MPVSWATHSGQYWAMSWPKPTFSLVRLAGLAVVLAPVEAAGLAPALAGADAAGGLEAGAAAEGGAALGGAGGLVGAKALLPQADSSRLRATAKWRRDMA